MPITIPILDRFPSIQKVVLCGLVDGGSADSLPNGEQFLCSKTTNGDVELWLRLSLNYQNEPPGIHVHVDIFTEDHCPSSELPTELIPFEELLEHLLSYGRSSDSQVSVYPLISYFVDEDSLPEHGLVRLLSRITYDHDETSIKLNGGEFVVENGGPVESIKWERSPDGAFEITMQGYVIANIDADYIETCLAPFGEVFNSMILNNPIAIGGGV